MKAVWSFSAWVALAMMVVFASTSAVSVSAHYNRRTVSNQSYERLSRSLQQAQQKIALIASKSECQTGSR